MYVFDTLLSGVYVTSQMHCSERLLLCISELNLVHLSLSLLNSIILVLCKHLLCKCVRNVFTNDRCIDVTVYSKPVTYSMLSSSLKVTGTRYIPFAVFVTRNRGCISKLLNLLALDILCTIHHPVASLDIRLTGFRRLLICIPTVRRCDTLW